MRANASNQLPRNRVLRALAAPALALAASGSPEEGFDAVLDLVGEVVPFDVCVLRVFDRKRNELALVAHRGLTTRLAKAIRKVQIGQGPSGRVAVSRHPLLIDDSEVIGEGLPHFAWGGRLPMHCFVGVPIGGEQLIGVLGVGRDRAEPLTVDDLTCLDLIGSQLATPLKQLLRGKGYGLPGKDLYYAMQVLRREEEGSRLAQDLHDTTLQDLLVICHRLKGLIQGERGSISEEVRSHLETTLAQSLRAVDEVRNLSRDLKPDVLRNMGLVGAIGWLADRLENERKITVCVTVAGRERPLFALRELAVFRVAQEALNNVRKHSDADSVRVHLSFGPKTLTMVIEDNGIGFQVPETMQGLADQGKLGLVGMRQRMRDLHGTMDIRSSLGKGAKITVQVPT